MTTLKDLSRHLGLSVTQVSRALNDHSDVAEATKVRVREAANILNYQANIAARKLVTGHSKIVGLVLSGVPPRSASTLYMQIIASMSAHFAKHGLHFMLHIADAEEDQVDVYRRLSSSGAIDGFIVFEPVRKDPRIAFLREKKIPFVLHGRGVKDSEFPYFDIDNWDVGWRLTRHLTDQGHQRIAFLNGSADRTYVIARSDGYRTALAEAGLDFEPALVRNGEMNEGYGLLETIHLFERKKAVPTAIIASNALVVKGIYAALKALGLDVPGDVSVVAHDDMLPDVRLAGFAPAVTATQAPLEHSWKPLSEFLVGAIEGRPIEELRKIEAVEFVERESVAPPPANR